MAYVEEQIEESLSDTALPLSSLTGMLGRQPTPRAKKNSKVEVAQEYICVDCGGPRSYGSGQRCKKCYSDRAAARRRIGEIVAAGIKPPEPEKVRTKELSKNGTKPKAESAQPEHAQEVKLDKNENGKLSIAENAVPDETSKEALAIVRDIIPEKFQTAIQRTEIRPAWSPAFEKEVGDPEGSVSLTMMYLISLLHHNMEPHEKEAVWTLVQYLKRIEAYVEQRKASE